MKKEFAVSEKGGKFRKTLFLIAVGIVVLLTARMFYSQNHLSKIDSDVQFMTNMQRAVNEGFDYTAIDGDAEKLRDLISKTHFELHGEIENLKIEKLRERLFDLIWTHHAGGFSNYMKLRKPAGIEYNFYTNLFPYYCFATNYPHLANELDYVEYSIGIEDNFTNLISEVCLDYEELQKFRNAFDYLDGLNTNSLFGVHIFRTNSLADPRFCEDALHHMPESERWPFTSKNFTRKFKLNTFLTHGLSIALPLYTTPDTPKQELETTGEITIAYACFAFKCIHHGNRGAPFVAQWHWDKALSRWITDYFCNGNDYRNPISRYYTEPSISTIF